MATDLPRARTARDLWTDLVRSMDLVGIRVRETVVLVQDNSLDLGAAPFPLEALIQRDREISKSWNGVMRQADAGLEKDSQHVERREISLQK